MTRNEIKTLGDRDLIVTGFATTLRFRKVDERSNQYGHTVRIWENEQYIGTSTDEGAQEIIDEKRESDGDLFGCRYE